MSIEIFLRILTEEEYSGTYIGFVTSCLRNHLFDSFDKLLSSYIDASKFNVFFVVSDASNTDNSVLYNEKENAPNFLNFHCFIALNRCITIKSFVPSVRLIAGNLG